MFAKQKDLEFPFQRNSNGELRYIDALLIEDNSLDLKLFQAYVERSGYSHLLKFRHETKLEKALETLRRSKFDIVITDLNLPDSFGFETIKSIKNCSPETPMIVLTSHDEPDLKQRAFLYGVQDFLDKSQLNGDVIFHSIEISMERQYAYHELQKNQMSARRGVDYDPKTILPTRKLFRHHLEQELMRTKRNQNLVAVIMADLKNFKNVNQQLSYCAGDLLLLKTGQIITKSLRECDMVSRLKEDNFAILISDLRGTSDIEIVLQKITSAVGRVHQLGQSEVQLDLRCGIAFFPLDSRSALELCGQAQIALARASASEAPNAYCFANLRGEKVQRERV